MSDDTGGQPHDEDTVPAPEDRLDWLDARLPWAVGSLGLTWTRAPAPRFHARIARAEAESQELCEECGSTGWLVSDCGWLRTVCELHGLS